MTALAEACAELATLTPALTAALTRDNTPSDARTVLSAGGVVNPDVLHAMITLAREIPAATMAAAALAGEPWQPRPVPTCLRAIPRLYDRLTILNMTAPATQLGDGVHRWMRMTKLALGLRTPDQPIGFDCPLHDQPAALLALGAEGFLRDDMTVLWQHAGQIWCPSCGASWPESQWPHLGRMLATA